MSETRASRMKFVGIAGLVMGALVGSVTVVLAGTALAQRLDAVPEAFLEVTHVPPLLSAPGDPAELRYDAYCGAADEPVSDAPCAVTGSVYVRAGQVGSFTRVPLREDAQAQEGRLSAPVPRTVARSASGFTYYAVVTAGNGRTVTLPSGGAGAPQRSLPLAQAVDISLPAHTFGRVRPADARVAAAAWGDGPAEVGLEDDGSPNVTPIGAAAFDVGRDGTVHVLDEANRRVLHWKAGAPTPNAIPLSIDGTLADMSVAADGTIHVLETAHRGGATGLLRSFAADGTPRGSTPLAERASQVRIGPAGPVVFQTTSGQWTSFSAVGKVVGATESLVQKPGRPVAGGREVVLLRTGNELRAALVGPGPLRRTWRIVSETPLAEVQLAEPLGDRLVVVFRTYTDQHDEFVVAVLGSAGVEQRFSVASADWAETAPLSRFRLVDGALYQLGSTPAGMFVDRIDLEVS
jgi:hypothetical protein